MLVPSCRRNSNCHPFSVGACQSQLAKYVILPGHQAMMSALFRNILFDIFGYYEANIATISTNLFVCI